ncbi:MAG: type I secretion system permease/ATPase [Betaproteobacteria bacterium]|nr:type I secretion system permease/ATPase [Betaproteobacteria bacterium]MDE2622401.1 type I secretion system permease/ATPase [Betaproteobacteria bacterium]
MSKPQKANEIIDALRVHRKAFVAVAAFSFVINFLYLTPSLYMLQVYDRVVVSRSELTLIFLSVITVAMFAVMGGLEYARSQVLIRVGNAIDEVLSKRVFTATFENNLRAGQGNPAQALGDLNNVRQFVTGNGLFAFLDAPWIPIYLVVIFMLHTMLGWFAVGGTLLLVVLTYITEKVSKKPLEEANRHAILASNFANSNLRNAEVIEAMGMLRPMITRWYRHQANMLDQQTIASNRAATVSAVTKLVRLVIQSGALGLGALLVIQGKSTAGVMIAASILTGRALAPVELLIGTWKGFSSARSAYERLARLLEVLPPRVAGMSLPAPRGMVTLENVYATPPGGKVAVIKGVNLSIMPGEVVGVIGPSASGKSSLARLMVGIWPAQVGKVRLDNADVYLWNKDELGPKLGYMPQDVELFNGTVAENIARFGAIDSDKVVDAARLAGVHEMILHFPNGYDTPIGEGGSVLSGGQRQRIGIARAIYGLPPFIVLDEPNSNLDDVGEAALVATVQALKQAGRTVVVITHRMSVLQAVDKLLLMRDGTVQAYGERDAVLQALAQARATQAQPSIPQESKA